MLRILRGLGGRALPCGCLVGIYETYAAQTIAVIDAKGADCVHAAHRVDAPVVPAMVTTAEHAQPPSTMPTMSR